jgi:Protein of unknown function (DUF2924)
MRGSSLASRVRGEAETKIHGVAEVSDSAASEGTHSLRRGGAHGVGIAGGSGLSQEIAGLADLDTDALRRRWRAMTGRQAPFHLPRHVLLRMLAYRIQVDAHGGLDLATEKFLECLGRSLERRATDNRDDSQGNADDGQGGEARATSGSTRQSPETVTTGRYGSIKPGTILVREHDGVVHRVMATGDGFAWNGTTYASLSKVAQAITGVNWSGPRFFGLLAKPGGVARNHDAGKSKGASRDASLSNRRATGGRVP